jgi:hypothetical protein
MTELKMFRSCTVVLALALGTAGTGWGTVAACATGTPGTSLTALGTASATSGCFQDDLSYTSLNLTGGAFTGGGTAPTTASISIYSTGTAASGNTIGPVNLFVDGYASITNGGTSSETGTVDAQVTANTGVGVGGLTYTAPTSSALHWAYTTLTLAPNVAAVGTGDTVTITENFCLNANQATLGNGCNAADQGTITATYTGSTTAAFTCAFGTTGICVTGTGEVNFAALPFAPTTIAMTDAVTIDRVTGTTVTLTNFEDTFGETSIGPEPASFGLMGAAIASLALIGWHKRKRQS